MSNKLDLSFKTLISTPGMGDPRFEQSVVYLCAHGVDGAFGLVMNKPARNVTMAHVLEQIDIDPATVATPHPVLTGGPVEPQRGFVLYRGSAGDDDDAQELEDGLVLSASTGILHQIARGRGPREWVLVLGYAGWGPGQLEQELAQNAWLIADTRPDLLFAPDKGTRSWTNALKAMGIDPAMLSGTAGRA